MSNTKPKTEAEKYLILNEYEANEHGAYIYSSTSGNHRINIEDILTDFHYEQSKESLATIDDLQKKVDKLEYEVSDLEDKVDLLEEDLGSAEEVRDEYEGIAEALMPQTLFDEKKLEILKRMYKHLTLDDLEAAEAPFKERTGYLDLNY